MTDIGQGSFDPSMFGFEESLTRRTTNRVMKPTECFIKISEHGGRARCRLTLDAKTATSVHESFGDRVSVASDKRRAIMIHAGDDLKVSDPSNRTGARSISVECMARKMLEAYGEPGNYWYEVVWDDEHMVILKPTM